MQGIFFGNYFYGLCTIGLSIEAALQQRFPLNSLGYYAAVFCVTILYYTKAYIQETTFETNNKRLLWYRQHKKFVYASQMFFTILLSVIGVVFIKQFYAEVLHMPAYHWLLIAVFPSFAAFYYGVEGKTFGAINLRNIGWLKPFIIGFVWGGLVTVYPVFYYDIIHKVGYQPTFIGSLLLLKNFMFVTVLCIMFDIKDYAMDHNQQLKTFVVKVGLRRTIFFILIPLCILGLGTFLAYGFTHNFSTMKILLNLIPFILLIIVAFSMKRRRPILYYLAIIDGLMLVKALCGSIAMIYF